MRTFNIVGKALKVPVAMRDGAIALRADVHFPRAALTFASYGIAGIICLYLSFELGAGMTSAVYVLIVLWNLSAQFGILGLAFGIGSLWTGTPQKLTAIIGLVIGMITCVAWVVVTYLWLTT